MVLLFFFLTQDSLCGSAMKAAADNEGSTQNAPVAVSGGKFFD